MLVHVFSVSPMDTYMYVVGGVHLSNGYSIQWENYIGTVCVCSKYVHVYTYIHPQVVGDEDSPFNAWGKKYVHGLQVC